MSHIPGSSTKRPSSNWQALQKRLPVPPATVKNRDASTTLSRKRRKIEDRSESPASTVATAETSFVRGLGPDISSSFDARNGESLSALHRMISGELEYSSHHQQPGKYLALDCEMVGVGPEGKESSLARISLVNYHGAIQLDVFVRQRERVVDYRTEFSGVRPRDMVNARPFTEVQKQVAELLKDRILVGHAVHNDLKALLLSHPHQYTRDTQIYAFKHKVVRTRRPALRHLVQQELGVTIQSGEHSSVTDARATMAVYRLHRREWEKGQRPAPSAAHSESKKRKRADVDDERSNSVTAIRDHREDNFPGGGKKGVSAGLSTVIKRRGPIEKDKWWTTLGHSSSKGSLRLKAEA